LEELAGVALAFATIKAPYLLPFLLVFAVRRQWRTLAGFVLTSLVLFAVPTAFFGPSAELGYFQSLVHAAQSSSHIGGYEPKANNSFAGFTQLLLPKGLASLLTIALDVVALAFVARAALKSSAIDIPLGLAAVVSILVAPHVLIHDLVLLVVPAAVALHHADRIPRINMLLTLSYVGIVAGFIVVSYIPVQLSVVVMCVLAAGLFRAVRSIGDEDSLQSASSSTDSHSLLARPALQEMTR
jgi:Glycosyltransferase family 87